MREESGWQRWGVAEEPHFRGAELLWTLRWRLRLSKKSSVATRCWSSAGRANPSSLVFVYSLQETWQNGANGEPVLWTWQRGLSSTPSPVLASMIPAFWFSNGYLSRV